LSGYGHCPTDSWIVTGNARIVGSLGGFWWAISFQGSFSKPFPLLLKEFSYGSFEAFVGCIFQGTSISLNSVGSIVIVVVAHSLNNILAFLSFVSCTIKLGPRKKYSRV